MKKNLLCLAVLTVLFFAVSCGSKGSDTETAEKSDNDGVDTEADNDSDSGNTEAADSEDSGDTEAADNDAANGDKTDSGDPDETDSGDSSDSSDSSDTADTGDQVTVKVNFETSCKASGGTIVNGKCVCNDEVCKAGIVCNFNEPHGCADNSFTECPDKTPVCKNDETTFVGKLSSCNSWAGSNILDYTSGTA